MNTVDSTVERRTAEAAQARTLLLVLVCFLLGLAVGAFLYYRATTPPSTNVSETGSKLAESTRAVLKALNAPVAIRFYSLLDPASTSEDLRNFAGRVDQLLSAYEQEAGGKIKVTRQTTQSDSAAQAASADGVKAFNLDKGEGCYLGLALTQGDQKESLAQLNPEWEPALESDLTRAILSVTGAQSVAARVAATAQADAAIAEEVKRSLPNFASVPVEQGKQMLRDAAMKELKAAMNEIEVQIKEARERLSQAQNTGSEAEQQAALKRFQQVQAEQTEKIKQITARSQAQIQAWEQIKRK